MFLYGVIMLAIGLVNVGGQDPSVSQRNYSQVFRDVPTLFQHIVAMLHEKPEILEKDDITTFLETVANGGKLAELISEQNRLKIDKRDTKIDYDFDENVDIGGVAQEYDWYLRKVDDGFDSFLSSMIPGASQLTSDEVVEMMIMVERKLEEYYNDTK